MTESQRFAQSNRPSFTDLVRSHWIPTFYGEAFDRVAARWGEHGLSTEPANRSGAEMAVRALYNLQGLPWPPRILWADSPGHAIRMVRGIEMTSAYGRLFSRDRLMPDGAGLASDWVRWPGRDTTTPPLQLVRDVGDQVLADVIPLPRTLMPWGTVSWTPHPHTGSAHLGQWDAPTFARHELGALICRRGTVPPGIKEVHKIGKMAGPWWAFEHAVVITDRPCGIRFDAQQRLHAEDGPAVTYRDGWGIHAWHGVRVPADLIEGPPWEPSRILTEPNVEVRRAAIEKIGWDRFIHDAGLKPVGRPALDPGNPGQLLTLYDTPPGLYRTPVRVLLCTNGSLERDGTRRSFGLTVPGSFIDPVGAAAWTFGWTRDEYAALEHRR